MPFRVCSDFNMPRSSDYSPLVYTTKICFFQALLRTRLCLKKLRWDTLIEQFRQENYRLFQLASQSVFTVALQAGLSALKTPYPFYANIYFYRILLFIFQTFEESDSDILVLVKKVGMKNSLKALVNFCYKLC